MQQPFSRRKLLKLTCTGLGSGFLGGCGNGFDWESFFQKNFQEMTPEEKSRVVQRLEKKYSNTYGMDVTVSAHPARENTVFGYGLDLSLCIGCRRCVYACVEENNISRDVQIHYIRVVKMAESELNLEKGEHYYYPAKVPEDGSYYMPIQCQQCDNPPCVKVCPVKALWQEADGIVVIDYDWCIGCRDCMAACPYRAIKFNWRKPSIPKNEINPETHYLGNRPRIRGVVEKCHLCIQRVRYGRYPACVEICPAGARKFGNLLDPESEIRLALKHFRTFKLKEELNTQPKFFYFFSLG